MQACSVTGTASYTSRLKADLEELAGQYDKMLAESRILAHNWDSGFIGFPHFYWAPSDDNLQALRMTLLAVVRELETRMRLLFPHPTPEVQLCMKEDFGLLRRWAKRGKGDHSIPRVIDEAKTMAATSISNLESLLRLLPTDPWPTRLVVDTNTLIDDPDVARFVPAIGARYMVHVLPVVLREVDDLKRAGRTPELREAAKRADRRLKAMRNNGDVRTGSRVQGDVHAVFEFIEPRSDGLPTWLELDVPDDRLVASTLLLQSRHPGSAVHIATSDLNLQNKLAAVGLPFLEPSDT